jgi:hypothetical protein
MTLLSAGQWTLALLSAAVGLVIASALWRLPQIQALEGPEGPGGGGADPEPTHRPIAASPASGAARTPLRALRRGR